MSTDSSIATDHIATDHIDWATDFDIFQDEFVTDPYPVFDTLRDECPIAHTDRWGGSWLPTRYEDVVAIAHEHSTFTSKDVSVVPRPPGVTEGPYGNVTSAPISSDLPDHHWQRRIILPTFSPQSVAKYEAGTRELCNTLIDGFIDRGSADAAGDYAQQIPVRVIAELLGVPSEMSDTFVSWVRGVLEVGLRDPQVRLENRTNIMNFFAAQVADRRSEPRDDDFITNLLAAQVDGKPVPDSYVLGVCNLMLVAGIDTTWSSIGSALWHLAQNPQHVQQLHDDPELWPTAIEELLRAYSPVTMARITAHDTEFHGCPMHTGDRILMAFPAANRDPRVFDRPNEVLLDREHNRHVAFGAGIHRCGGSNLARLEMRVALQTWLTRIPEFSLDDPAAVTWAGGQVRGPRSCIVRF
jgi:cytochrome P450